ncbi:MFS transporter-like protein [Trichodelitschia bisporula]|uniref:MFS transporter-like protein n=1 Tax=Trichodelitschia bisporula TaxID=703511 RepID=A0A6G1I2M4_9PEZI|nr:MFS transporter-like protein [Trichodelitschia bisporula]
MEKRVVRKLDFHVIPLVVALYLLSFLDRSNIGNAKIAGMSEDLKLTSPSYDWLLTIFYISYIVFEWQALMWKVIPPHIWGAFSVLGWGIISSAQAAATSWKAMMALRFLLGVTEAGFGPGIPYLLSFFYERRELGLRIGLFVSAAPLATTFAGALAFGITSGHAKLAAWRLLFLVEGLPTVAMAVVTFFFLPDTPDTARFLTEDEKHVARARAIRQAGREKRVGIIQWREVGIALLDPKAWFTALIYFSTNVSFSSLPVFLPTILKEMGFTAINAQGLTAPPFFLAFLATVITTWIADRTQQRGLVIMIVATIGGIGYILLATCKSVGARYTGVILAGCGVFPVIGNTLPWVLNNQGTDTRRGVGIVLLNLIGQCGPLLGTRLYPGKEGPFYVKGQSICAAFMFLDVLLAFLLRTLLKWENKKLDRQYGTLDEQRVRAEAAVARGESEKAGEGEGVENYGPLYRYVL